MKKKLASIILALILVFNFSAIATAEIEGPYPFIKTLAATEIIGPYPFIKTLILENCDHQDQQ